MAAELIDWRGLDRAGARPRTPPRNECREGRRMTYTERQA